MSDKTVKERKILLCTIWLGRSFLALMISGVATEIHNECSFEHFLKWEPIFRKLSLTEREPNDETKRSDTCGGGWVEKGKKIILYILLLIPFWHYCCWDLRERGCGWWIFEVLSRPTPIWVFRRCKYYDRVRTYYVVESSFCAAAMPFPWKTLEN